MTLRAFEFAFRVVFLVRADRYQAGQIFSHELSAIANTWILCPFESIYDFFLNDSTMQFL